jgi:hypothetical protein
MELLRIFEVSGFEPGVTRHTRLPRAFVAAVLCRFGQEPFKPAQFPTRRHRFCGRFEAWHVLPGECNADCVIRGISI